MSSVWHQQVSATADRPARHSASGPQYCTQMSTVSVINWWPGMSPVYNTDRLPKLTAPETISRSRDMVGAHQNVNGSRDLTTPLSGTVWHSLVSNYYRQYTYQIWSFCLHSLRRYEKRYKMWNGWFGVVRVTQSH